MNMLVSVYKYWCDRIFKGEKTVEFRRRQWKELHVGEKFYFYEPKRNDGCGMVVGEATIQDIIPVHPCSVVNRKLLRYWAEFVRKDAELVENINLLDGYTITGSSERFSYDYIYNKDAIRYLKEHDAHPSIYMLSYEECCKAQEMQRAYESWQKNVGFRDQYGNSCYFVAYILTDPVKYKTPRAIEEFQNHAGIQLSKAPQSGCYVIDPAESKDV